jgi:hypothetical protein
MATDPDTTWPWDGERPSAFDLRLRLNELHAELVLVMRHGLSSNATYMTDLERDIAEVTAAYTTAAVTDMATERRELIGPQVG